MNITVSESFVRSKTSLCKVEVPTGIEATQCAARKGPKGSHTECERVGN